MLFLGTGAAELLPSPFCSCELCTRARQKGDPRDMRRRSTVLLDEHNLIDCGPDLLYASIQFQAPLTKLKNIFMTHLHSDHLDFRTLEALSNAVGEAPRLNVYMARDVCSQLPRLMEDVRALGYIHAGKYMARWEHTFRAVPMTPFEACHVDGMRVTLLPSNHSGLFTNEPGAYFLFEAGGKSLLVAMDTNLPKAETTEFLSSKRVDTILMDGTYGLRDVDDRASHINLERMGVMVDALRAQGTLTEESRIVVTHISHKALLLHTEYEQRVKGMFGPRAMVAYDGLRLE